MFTLLDYSHFYQKFLTIQEKWKTMGNLNKLRSPNYRIDNRPKKQKLLKILFVMPVNAAKILTLLYDHCLKVFCGNEAFPS